MEFPNEKIMSLNSLEAEINDKIVNKKSQCTSVSQLSKSTSENSDTFQKKILHKPISSAFALKRSKDLRQSYYDQLISLQILPKDEQKREYNSIIIFDWDDTLFCSSYYIKKKCFESISEAIQSKINKLEQCVYQVLSMSIQYGDTYIITNANQNWVDFSAAKYYPSIVPLLLKIKVMSARSLFESKFPNDSRMWKLSAFAEVGKLYEENKVTNLICLGDSEIEIEAGNKLSAMFVETFLKTVKFREEPKPEHIIKQLSLFSKQFEEIHSSARNISIKVEKKREKK